MCPEHKKVSVTLLVSFGMMKPKRQHLVFLELLVTTHQTQRQALLENLSESQVAFLSSILHNILKSNIVLGKDHRSKLLRYAAVIRRLANKATPNSIKETLFKKHHKLIVLILKPLLPLLKNKFCHGSRDDLSANGAVE